MSEYLTSFTNDYDYVIRTAKICDIIEFNRLSYSHFGFYIGNGDCIHITGDESRSTSSGSSGSSSKGRKCAMPLKSIAGRDSCRVNNLEIASTLWIGVARRSTEEALKLAMEGLLDDEGKISFTKFKHVPYDLKGLNCESYAVYWRYDLPKPQGYSQQAYNPLFGSTLGNAQRLCDAAAAGYIKYAKGEETPPLAKVACAAASVPVKAVAVTAGVLKASGDVVTSAAVGVVRGVEWLFK